MYFCDIAQFGAVLLHFEGVPSLGAIECHYMSRLHLSPMIFWTQLKRAVRPLVDAGGDTLRALGLEISDTFTVHALLVAVAEATADNVTPMDVEVYRQITEILQ